MELWPGRISIVSRLSPTMTRFTRLATSIRLGPLHVLLVEVRGERGVLQRRGRNFKHFDVRVFQLHAQSTRLR